LPHDDSSTSALVAAPRHLRRRRFHSEIPDSLLVPDAEPLARDVRGAAEPRKRVLDGATTAEMAHQRKRMVALMGVLAVCLTVPILIVALLVVR